MANANSLTIGNTTLPVANSLAALDDTNTSNAAAGNILTFNGTSWTNGTLTGNNGVSVSRNGVNYTLSGDASWTKTQAIAAPLTGLNTSLTGNVTASDTVLSAIGKLAVTPRARIDLVKTDVVTGGACFLNFYPRGVVRMSMSVSMVYQNDGNVLLGTFPGADIESSFYAYAPYGLVFLSLSNNELHARNLQPITSQIILNSDCFSVYVG